MRIKTEKGYWIMKDFQRMRFFPLKRLAKKYMAIQNWEEPEYYIKKGTQSYKI